MLLQGLAYLAIAYALPEIKQGIANNQNAHGIFLGGASLCIGLINAACLVY
jgi:putative membrane protein